jgi:hypothetical protein
MRALSLAALGVVFGDIGTSPLYTLNTVLDVTGGTYPEPGAILGALSLITPHHVDRSLRRGPCVWRCGDHAGNFGHVSTAQDFCPPIC